MNHIRKATIKGLTAIELLIITSIIALIVVFATPMMSSVFFESDLDKAAEITDESINKARLAARFYKSKVEMRFNADGELVHHGITISRPRGGKEQLLSEVIQEFPLPVTIRIVSGDMLVNFDANGEVDIPAMVLIASNKGEFERRELIIE